MDIDLLSKMVKELIPDHDRICLPGFGCFVTEIVPSAFSDRGYTINPPYRRLSFRTGNISEDTLLVDLYASSNGVNQEVAGKIISEFISELKKILMVKKTVVFPGLGRMRATRENNFFFVADEDLDIYPEGFGLEPVSLKSHQETRAEVSAMISGLQSMMEDGAEKRSGGADDAGPSVPESAAEPEKTGEEAASLPETGVEDNAEAEEPAAPGLAADSSEDVKEADKEVPEESPEESQTGAHEETMEETMEEAEEEVPEESQVEAHEETEEEVPEESQAGAHEETMEETMDEAVEDVPGESHEETHEENREEVREENGKDEEKETAGGDVKHSPWRTVLIVVGCIIGLAVLLLAVYLLAAHFCPDFIDSLLYDSEQLDVLRYGWR